MEGNIRKAFWVMRYRLIFTKEEWEAMLKLNFSDYLEDTDF